LWGRPGGAEEAGRAEETVGWGAGLDGEQQQGWRVGCRWVPAADAGMTCWGRQGGEATVGWGEWTDGGAAAGLGCWLLLGPG